METIKSSLLSMTLKSQNVATLLDSRRFPLSSIHSSFHALIHVPLKMKSTHAAYLRRSIPVPNNKCRRRRNLRLPLPTVRNRVLMERTVTFVSRKITLAERMARVSTSVTTLLAMDTRHSVFLKLTLMFWPFTRRIIADLVSAVSERKHPGSNCLYHKIVQKITCKTKA